MGLNLAERVARSRLGGGILNAVRAKKRHRRPVKTNRFDNATWTSARATKPVNDMVRDLFVGDEHRGGTRKPYEQAEELVEGVFHLFYKANPHLSEKRELERDLFPVAKILEDLGEHPRISELHDYTFTNETMSTLATADMHEVLQEAVLRLQEVQPPPPPAPPSQGQGDGQGEGQSPAQGQPQEGSDQGESDDEEGQEGGQPDGQGEGQDGAEGESDDAGDEAESEWEEGYDELLDDLNIEGLLDQGVNEALRDLEKLDGRIRGIGIEPGQWESMTPEKRLAMAEWLSGEEMKDLADMVGRMKKYALDIRKTRITDDPLEAYDVELGDDLTVILQEQYALLSDPLGQLEFYRRYADRELLQFKRRGEEPVAKGPIICAIDNSGSMEGKPSHWAIGIAEALRRFAADDDRDFYAIYFGTNVQRQVFHFPEGKGTVEQIIAFLSMKPGWGTHFDGVLREALNHAVTAYDDESKGKADICFITDGRAELTDAWIEQFNKDRAEAETHLYSVFVSGADDVTSSPVKLLERISDLVIPANYLKPAAAREIFSRV